MFFTLSKIFWGLAQPLNALCLLGLMGLLIRQRWKAVGQWMMNTALALILILGILPIGPMMLTFLERQYPTPQELPAQIDGIIVLGGAFESYLTKIHGQITSNDQVDRMFCFVDLAQKYPNAKLVFSGGSGDIMNPEAMETEDARAFFKLVGLNRDVIYEDKSRNTYENAVYTNGIVKPKAGENWIVTTSAYHMPRSVGIFEKIGWHVIPYACDFRTDGTYDPGARFPSVAGNFSAMNTAVKEFIGSIVYYMTGKSAFILPPGRLASPDENEAP